MTGQAPQVFAQPPGQPEAAPDVRLVEAYGPARCLHDGILPFRNVGGCTLVLTTRLPVGRHHRDRLTRLFGAVRFATADERQLERGVRAVSEAALLRRAEARVPRRESSRLWARRRNGALALVAAGLVAAASAAAPVAVLLALIGLATTLLVLSTALKLAAALASPARRLKTHDRSADRPTISLLVPLFRERDIAGHLLKRLEALDYPRARLEVCLILEADDRTTAAALDTLSLPAWVRTLSVPAGTLRTKPRALNYALDFTHGEIVGVYDAEDAPAPDQLLVIAERFARRGPQVACLQGTLDYYNVAAGWLTRCFTLEYAVWFRVVLPGLARMGLVVPLGGTTLFLRRTALEHLGAWDAHNVTEDADLGLRLARHGYRTELIGTVTEEEATSSVAPWVRQRSRWLKGYAMTYAVHMRDPAHLLRDLGTWRTAGVQLVYLGTVLQFALAPLLWLSFWLLPATLGEALPGAAWWALLILFLAAEAVNLVLALVAARRAGKPGLALWAPTLVFYFPLATLALYRALWQLFLRPFYWDKTAHGASLAQELTPPPRPPPRPASGA
ncbi:glycosyltransferase family 2 protein [Histidinibacterium aquaticum]|uniref:Glycosyltransferase n=1 Tax=Histidinibacterium aquaticum TaxID=2613962 RepID=A0A5J5GRG8_9RHOB|nr:glycosyltransferase family 2 protein [Histidinibacterium aquaticum]KAA9010124.1 glycosyltransferase [Histidinibacterium aquaticum]